MLAALLLAGALLPLTAPAATWLPAGDGRLRSDVDLLVDEGVLRLSTTSWPIAVDDVAYAMRRIDPADFQSAALAAAFDRVAAYVTRAQVDGVPGLDDVQLRGGKASLLRGFDAAVREEGELAARGHVRAGRITADLQLTAVTSPVDGQQLRVDGSSVSLRFGNWHFSAGAPERWWGPGNESSLILSTNARPMLQLALDRVVSTPSSVPILRWAGPWRFSAFLARAEGERADVDRALFMGMRLSFKPWQILDIGLSRSAQFCGAGRPCDLETFGRVLLGRDNAGIRVSPEDEPGNQMAGADIRLTSPFRPLPLALYAQLIGEDSSSTAIPEKYLGLLGVEGWAQLDDGSTLRGYVEYSDTACSFERSEPYVGCAYRQGIFYAGYRYRGRNIGHTTDSDAEMLALGVRLVRAGGDEWRVRVRSAHLNRFGVLDPYNLLAPADARKYQSAEAGWRGRVLGQELAVVAGAQRGESSAGTRDVEGYGSVSVRVRF